MGIYNPTAIRDVNSKCGQTGGLHGICLGSLLRCISDPYDKKSQISIDVYCMFGDPPKGTRLAFCSRRS